MVDLLDRDHQSTVSAVVSKVDRGVEVFQIHVGSCALTAKLDSPFVSATTTLAKCLIGMTIRAQIFVRSNINAKVCLLKDRIECQLTAEPTRSCLLPDMSGIGASLQFSH